jgi:hypothetical protein
MEFLAGMFGMRLQLASTVRTYEMNEGIRHGNSFIAKRLLTRLSVKIATKANDFTPKLIVHQAPDCLA